MTDDNTPALFSPGEYIRDEIAARGWTQEALAHILGRPLRTVNQIISGNRAITPQTAQELAAAFGTSAELWMNLESAYRLSLDKQEQGDVSRRAQLYDQAPIRDLIRRRWIQESDSPEMIESELKRFFEAPFAMAARMSSSYDTITPAQRAWMCRAFHLASAVRAKPFRANRAIEMLGKLHALTVSEHEVRRVPEVLSEMGIRFLVLEHLPRTKIDGAVLWIDDSPVIALSLRFDRIDGFWHTLSHEVVHVLNGDKWTIDEDLIGANRIGFDEVSEKEQRTDREASEFLIQKAKLDSFISRHKPRFSKADIIRFANLHQIHPGIVVGQLQYRKAIQYSHSREMLVPIRQMIADSALTDGWGHFPGM